MSQKLLLSLQNICSPSYPLIGVKWKINEIHYMYYFWNHLLFECCLYEICIQRISFLTLKFVFYKAKEHVFGWSLICKTIKKKKCHHIKKIILLFYNIDLWIMDIGNNPLCFFYSKFLKLRTNCRQTFVRCWYKKYQILGLWVLNIILTVLFNNFWKTKLVLLDKLL